jgi:hypothetical protein
MRTCRTRHCAFTSAGSNRRKGLSAEFEPFQTPATGCHTRRLEFFVSTFQFPQGHSEKKLRQKARQEVNMRGIKVSTNFAVFLLFFGVAALEALQTHNWVKAIFWVAIGACFLVADNSRRTSHT